MGMNFGQQASAEGTDLSKNHIQNVINDINNGKDLVLVLEKFCPSIGMFDEVTSVEITKAEAGSIDTSSKIMCTYFAQFREVKAYQWLQNIIKISNKKDFLLNSNFKNCSKITNYIWEEQFNLICTDFYNIQEKNQVIHKDRKSTNPEKKEILSKYCSNISKYTGPDNDETYGFCTKFITKIDIGKFSFKAINCERRWMGFTDDCILKFGIKTNMIIQPLKEVGLLSNYRIINGPLPFSLRCIDGLSIGFADLDVWNLEGFEGIETNDYFHGQSGERLYYHNPSDTTFSFFSKNKKTIGVMLNGAGASGRGSLTLYLFDTKTGESAILYSDCNGIKFN